MELPLVEVLKKEKGCFVFVSDKGVHVSCGAEASVGEKLGAGELAEIMKKKRGLKGEEVRAYQST